MKALIDAGADLNMEAKNGDTALILAANRGYTDCVKVLLKAGADVNGKNKKGERE